jgi:integrase
MAKKKYDGFYKRGKVWWIRTDPLTQKPASTGKRDVDSARLEYQRRARVASDPNYEPETSQDETIEGWVTQFLEQKQAMRAGGTATFYRSKLGHVVRLFGAQSSLHVLRPKGFDAYAKQRKKEGARHTTILKEIRAAGTLARFAKKRGGFHGDPSMFRPDDLDDDYEPGERYLLPEELPALLTVLSPKRSAHVALSVAIGPRYSEAFRVTRADVNLTNWTVRIQGTKTRGSRAWVPVAEPFHGLLMAALPFLPLEPWSNMTRDLERACLRAGIAKVTANDLRRTHGSWLVEAGVSDSLVSRVLRHVDERMVRRVYGRSRPEKLGAAIDAQIQHSKTLQLGPVRPEGDQETPENPSNVRVAQSVEQRIEKPIGLINQPAEIGQFPAEESDSGASDVSQRAAVSRHVRYKNVTADVSDVDEHDFRVAVAEDAERAEAVAATKRGDR